MIVEPSSTLSVLLSVAATLLGFSLLVQVLQELYKYLTSSKSRAYTMALKDFLGPLWGRAIQSSALAALLLRGPGQWRRLRPGGVLLPLDQFDLSQLLERTSPAWIQRCLAALRAEVELQEDMQGSWSPAWPAFLAELLAVDKASPGYWTARDLASFFTTFGHLSGPSSASESEQVARQLPVGLSASYLLSQFRTRFLAHVVHAEDRYGHLQQNFDFAYRRRNLRQTFLISLAVAVACNLPFDEIYRKATQLSPADAVALAERTTSLAKDVQKVLDTAQPTPPPTAQDGKGGDKAASFSQTNPVDTGQQGKTDDKAVSAASTASTKSTPAPTPTPNPVVTKIAELEGTADAFTKVASNLAEATKGQSTVDYLLNLREVWDPENGKGWWALVRFFFGCLLTAVLASFGAPFWNDATGALLRLATGPAAKRAKDEG